MRKFQVGDYVTSTYHANESALVRQVIAVDDWLISTDEGGRCKWCHRPFGHRITLAPAEQFELSNQNPDNTAIIRQHEDNNERFN